jgi:hypothetical protein
MEGLKKMKIDINFNFYTDARGGDPDSTSPTLRRYHKLLWSKPLPNGNSFELRDDVGGAYLCHSSELGEFFLGSDAITHSYKNQKRKQWLVQQIPLEVDGLFNTGSTIGAYILFPNRRIDGRPTMNQARGVNSLIDDRFDLTLECIRRFYLDMDSPLYDTILRYRVFFDLFLDFNGYVNFFLLDDLVDGEGSIKFFLPFDDYIAPPAFRDVDDYLAYKHQVIEFIQSRNRRIADYARSIDSH